MTAMREASKSAGDAFDALSAQGKLSPGPGRPASEVASHQSARLHGAMIEIVAERGYGAVTIRELVGRAGVSTRAFYEHFVDTEECFLRTHELIVRRLVMRIAASQVGRFGWQDRLRIVFDALAHEIEREPEAAILILIEAYTAGPAAVKQTRRAERTLEVMIAESLARAPSGIDVSPLLAEGMVAGVVSVVRSRLLAKAEKELPQLVDDLTAWALSLCDGSVGVFAEMESPALLAASIPSHTTTPTSEERRASASDRSLILIAVTKLATTDGYRSLTVQRIRAAAGVSRRSFNEHFESVEDSFLAAFEQLARQTLIESSQGQSSDLSWEGGIYRAMITLCVEIATDPVLASLCFAENLAAGAQGMRGLESVMENVVTLIRESAPCGYSSPKLSLRASTGAVWGVLHHYVADGQAWQAPCVARTLTYLILAPVISASVAAGGEVAPQ